MKKLLLTLSFLLTLPHLASAEVIASPTDIAKSKRFVQYIHSQFVVGTLYQYAVTMSQRLGIACNDPYNIDPDLLGIEKPLNFPEDALHPVDGAWLHRFTLERCGQRSTFNLYFVAQPKDKPKPIPMIMGNTNTSIILLRNVIPAVYARVGTLSKSRCSVDDFQKTIVIRDSIVLDPGNENYWKEGWVVSACQMNYNVYLTFTADGKGGTNFQIN